jgi:hypothetical protein
MTALRRASKFAIYAAALLLPTLIAAREGAQPKPLWHFDLKEVGYHRTNYAKAKFYALSVVRPKISFLGPDTVVVAFASGDPKQPPLTGAWTLHVTTLDARTGRLKLHKTFPIVGHEAGIFVSADNNLIVWLGATLTLLSPEFQTIRQRELPKSRNPAWTNLRFALSPTRRTLFVGSTDQLTAEMLDTRTLESVTTCKCSELGELPMTITDRFAARLDGKTKKVLVSEPCREWTPIPAFNVTAYPNNVRFLNDDMLVVGQANIFTLLQRSGSVLKTVSFPKHSLAKEAFPSHDDRQFALSGMLMGGIEIPALDIYRHPVSVQFGLYDAMAETESMALEIAPGYSEVAMSADASMLVAVADDEVQLFKLGK